jgi:hypothetical protein
MEKRMKRIQRIETDYTTRQKIRFYPLNPFNPFLNHPTKAKR